MDNTAEQIREAIEKSQQVGILVTKNPTLDIMGAGLSLYLSLQEMGKRVSIASPTEPIVELTSLVGIDQVRQSLSASDGDLVVSFPYKEGEIEKVSYTVEGGYLNIVVKASEEGLSFTEQDVKFSHGTGAVDLLIVIGAQSPSDLETLYNQESMANATIITIDNRQDNTGFGDIVMITPQSSSLSEEMASLLLGMGIEPDIDTAQNLFNGIAYGTENFQSPKTTPKAFEMAGIMMRKGAVRMNIVPSFPRPQVQPQQSQQQNRPMPRPQQQFGNRQRDQRGQNRPMPRPQMPQRNPQQNRPMAMPQPQAQQVQQPAPQVQAPQQQAAPDDRPPADWLTPKVYKGSSNIS